MEINNTIAISDTHCGCQLGLCSPVVSLRHGGVYRASPFQRKVWEHWRYFWDKWVPMVTRGEPYVIAMNGDMMDGRHHGSTHQFTQDLSDQKKVAYDILAREVDKSHGLYFVSGTPAHVGESAENEEDLAKDLGAVQDKDTGNYSRFELYLQTGNALCHFSHHIGVTGSMAYETTALTKEFNEFCAESARWDRPIPDIIVRSHRHRHAEVRVPTSRGYGIIFVTGSWQLKTPFIFRVPGGRVTTPMVGGSLIRQGDEEHYTRHKIWETDRAKTEMPTVEGCDDSGNHQGTTDCGD